jgi:hypothetical protein
MNSSSNNPRTLKIIRWIRRGWSILILVTVLLIIFMPPADQNQGVANPVRLIEIFELGSYGLSVLGLVLAWRWEMPGAVIAILGVVGHDVVFVIDKGYWMVGNFIVVLVFVIPAILFLVCWGLPLRKREGYAQSEKPGSAEAVSALFRLLPQCHVDLVHQGQELLRVLMQKDSDARRTRQSLEFQVLHRVFAEQDESLLRTVEL